MKKFYKSLLLIAMLIVGLNASAQDFEVDGISYNILSDVDLTCEVTKSLTPYSGAVKIPKKVPFNNQEYKIVGIEARAFQNCTELKSLITGDGIETIGTNAFKGCTGLGTIFLGKNLKSIGQYAFNGCSVLTEINVLTYTPPTLTKTTFDEFHYQNSAVQIMGGSESEYKSALYWEQFMNLKFNNFLRFEYYGITYDIISLEDSSCEVKSANNAYNSFKIPEYVKYKGFVLKVVSIGSSAFNGFDFLYNIKIPKTVREINAYAFSGVARIKNLIIDDGNELIHIGKCGNGGAFNEAATNSSYPIENVYIGRDIDCYDKYDKKNYPIFYIKGYWGFDFKIKNVIIGDSVTELRDSLFVDCKLDSLTLGKKVQRIGYSAVKGNQLKQLVIPESVKIIDNRAFAESRSLDSLKISDGVEVIGRDAFSECRKLQSIEIPNSVTKIGGGAFKYATSATSLKISNKVDTIGNSAFYHCSGLTSVEIPEKVKLIGDRSFSECSSLKSVLLPKGIKAIEESAFYNCAALTSVIVPSGEIGGSAFSGCTALTSVTIGCDVPIVGRGAFSGCTALKHLDIEDGNTILKTGHQGGGFNPGGLPNPKYPQFEGCPLETLYLGRDLEFKDIENGKYVSPFESQKNLKSVTIGNEVTKIGERSFLGCSVLNSVTIPNSVTSIGESAFESCNGLTSVNISNSVTTIGERAFSGCIGLTSLKLPENLISLGGGALKDCSGISSIVIPNKVITIGSATFSGCSELCSIILSNSIEKIGGYAFHNCSSLTSVKIPDNVKDLGQGAFENCANLDTLYIGSGINAIYGSTFVEGCKSLRFLRFEDSDKSIYIDYGRELNSYGDRYVVCGMFHDCPLENLYIGRNVTYNTEVPIGKYWIQSPFLKTRIKKLVLSKNVTMIEREQFSRCSNTINEVYSLNPIPPKFAYFDLFSDVCYNNATLYIPQGSLNAYKQAEGWKNFLNIQEKIITGVENIEQDISDEVKVFANGNMITVVGAEEDAVVEIFNLNGQLVCRGFGNEFEVGNSGVYIVRIAGKTYKVVM